MGPITVSTDGLALNTIGPIAATVLTVQSCIFSSFLMISDLKKNNNFQFQMLESDEIEKHIQEIEKEKEEEAEKKKQKK